MNKPLLFGLVLVLASAGAYHLGELNPSRRAKSTTRSGPTSFISQTAGTLRDFSNARRSVIGPS